jgi:small GTP-binding protein
MSGKEPLKCKIVLIGEKGVGKTSIIDRYVRNNFMLELLSTAGLCYTEKTVLIKDYNQSIKFEIWDTAGQEKYRSLAKVFYTNGDAIILIYDITERRSFEEIKNYWINEIKANISTKPSNSQIYNIIIFYSICTRGK